MYGECGNPWCVIKMVASRETSRISNSHINNSFRYLGLQFIEHVEFF